MPTHSGLSGNRSYDVFCLIRLLAQGDHLTKIPLFDQERRASVDAAWERGLCEALRMLTICAWWNRIWVVQEIVVSRNATVLFGSMVAPWNMFVAASVDYVRHASSCCAKVVTAVPPEYTKVISHFCRINASIHDMQSRYGGRNAQYSGNRLLQLLRQFRVRAATDPRDKVYALLGIIQSQPSVSSMGPDYSLTIAQVF